MPTPERAPFIPVTTYVSHRGPYCHNGAHYYRRDEDGIWRCIDCEDVAWMQPGTGGES